MYKFSSAVRKRFAKKLSELPWAQVSKNKETSFYNMKNILVHMIENEDWIVNWVVLGKGTQFDDKNYNNYTSMKQITNYLEEVETQTQIFL
jgi:uncharacterized damage-inducible protein DinB